MRVGVFFPFFDPRAGGGYTFEQEILQALRELASESHHELILYFPASSAQNLPSLPGAKNLCSKWLIPPTSVSTTRSLTRAIKKLLFKKVEANPKSLLQIAIEQDNIHLVWFPTSQAVPVEIPYIATIWDLQHRIQPWFPEVSQNGQWQFRENYFANYLQRSTFIITPNQTGQNEIFLAYQVPAERFRRLPHPSPRIDHIPSIDEVQLILSKYELSNRYLFYPAQFWAHKNHINLLKALKILRETYKLDLDLVLVGSDQGNLQYVQAIVEELDLKEIVHFLGFIPREDLIALYTGAFALSYVTYFGPENLPPLEAFTCGCPVIASDVPGAIEQFGDTVLRVDPSSPEDIALAVRKLHDDPGLRTRLITSGRIRSRQYTSLDYVRAVFKIMDEFEPIRINWP